MSAQTMTALPDTVLCQAIDWHLALAEADSDRWHDFILWLEADETHRAAYDRVSIDDALIEGRRAPRAAILPLAAPAPRQRAPQRRAWAAGLVAMLASGVAFVSVDRPAPPARYAFESPADAARSVTLSDGTRIDLNRGGRLILERGNPRLALLDRGEAMFHVHHDAAAPFRVEAGGRTIEDVGTAFNIVAEGDGVDIAVSQGAVRYEPQRGGPLLTAGMTLHSPTPGAATLGRTAAADIGGWTQGRLAFDDAPLGDVARALGRSLGVPVQIDPALDARRFSGTIRSDRSAEQAVRTLAALSGTAATRDRQGWRLSTDGDGAR